MSNKYPDQMRVIILIIVLISLSQLYSYASNTIVKRNVLLRKKRYLTFPKGSTLIIQLSAIKAIQQIQPMYWNFLEELEFAFFLPDNPKMFRRKDYIKKNKREVFSVIEDVLQREGYNGKACVKLIICGGKNSSTSPKKSMVKDILLTIFNYSGNNFHDDNSCMKNLEEQCTFSFLHHLLQDVLGIKVN